ncbi:MAG: excinuclease ABC subunit UvrC [Candidatus Omnitrophota bacterium]|nr:excinuclease ABC subunit UvrC [Candidatus Omnitrophota bacterium]
MGIKEIVASLPQSPGVYIMKGVSGDVLYVGKANDLRKRVSSYFQRSRAHPQRIESLVSKIANIEFIPVSTSAEALIYENGLIKQLSPKYNVALRDDKSYPLLKLTVSEKFPRLIMTREKKGDGSIYYGPYTSAKLLKEALKILQKLFPLRTCSKMPASRPGRPKKECLQFHIQQCVAPCSGRIDTQRYNDLVAQLKLFLEGRRAELLKFLSNKMKELSKSENFEEALEYRNRLEALSVIKEGSVSYTPMDELEELRRILGIKDKLERIEAFDISNIMGDQACASMVHFYKGKPNKNEYRKFKIKTVSGMDDYSMMREVVRRRYARSLKEEKALPDLIVIDGGRGHLGVAMDELKKLSLDNIPTIGIAKEFERIYVKDRKDPIVLPKESKSLHLLERIRDEAHRFAISYHKKLMSKRIFK